MNSFRHTLPYVVQSLKLLMVFIEKKLDISMQLAERNVLTTEPNVLSTAQSGVLGSNLSPVRVDHKGGEMCKWVQNVTPLYRKREITMYHCFFSSAHAHTSLISLTNYSH
jgi:hypothetical protein